MFPFPPHDGLQVLCASFCAGVNVLWNHGHCKHIQYSQVRPWEWMMQGEAFHDLWNIFLGWRDALPICHMWRILSALGYQKGGMGDLKCWESSEKALWKKSVMWIGTQEKESLSEWGSLICDSTNLEATQMVTLWNTTQQQKRMNDCYTQCHGWISKSTCWMKEDPQILFSKMQANL